MDRWAKPITRDEKLALDAKAAADTAAAAALAGTGRRGKKRGSAAKDGDYVEIIDDEELKRPMKKARVPQPQQYKDPPSKFRSDPVAAAAASSLGLPGSSAAAPDAAPQAETKPKGTRKRKKPRINSAKFTEVHAEKVLISVGGAKQPRYRCKHCLKLFTAVR